MNKDVISLRKSLMYKIISLGFPVYVGDNEDEFLVTALLCNECGEIWSMSRSECMFCGFENPHIYECSVCNKKYSITRSSKKCCGKNLSKRCINKECITNTVPEIQEMFDMVGGVFETSKSGAVLNEMRCKSCGCKTNIYKSVIIKMVEDFNHYYDKEMCIVKREKDGVFLVRYEGEKYIFNDIKKLLMTVLDIKKIDGVVQEI